jgi:hypothetical protein
MTLLGLLLTLPGGPLPPLMPRRCVGSARSGAVESAVPRLLAGLTTCHHDYRPRRNSCCMR